MDDDAIAATVRKTNRVLIVHEDTVTGVSPARSRPESTTLPSNGWMHRSSGWRPTTCRCPTRRSWRISCCRRRRISSGLRGGLRSISPESRVYSNTFRVLGSFSCVCVPQQIEQPEVTSTTHKCTEWQRSSGSTGAVGPRRDLGIGVSSSSIQDQADRVRKVDPQLGIRPRSSPAGEEAPAKKDHGPEQVAPCCWLPGARHRAAPATTSTAASSRPRACAPFRSTAPDPDRGGSRRGGDPDACACCPTRSPRRSRPPPTTPIDPPPSIPITSTTPPASDLPIAPRHRRPWLSAPHHASVRRLYKSHGRPMPGQWPRRRVSRAGRRRAARRAASSSRPRPATTSPRGPGRPIPPPPGIGSRGPMNHAHPSPDRAARAAGGCRPRAGSSPAADDGTRPRRPSGWWRWSR